MTLVKAFQWLGLSVFTGAVGAVFTFALWRSISLEALASVLVAVGTFILAYFTWQSVARTGDVIAGEDRRHQQGFAPLLVIEASATQRRAGDGAETGIRVYNIGYGLALNIAVSLEGALQYDAIYMHEDTEENKQRFAGKFESAVRSRKDDKDFINVTERESEPFDRHLELSALEAGGSYFKHEQVFFERLYGNPAALYKVAVANYEDTFGNRYSTKYLDEGLDYYEWGQPKHLRIPNPESR